MERWFLLTDFGWEVFDNEAKAVAAFAEFIKTARRGANCYLVSGALHNAAGLKLEKLLDINSIQP